MMMMKKKREEQAFKRIEIRSEKLELSKLCRNCFHKKWENKASAKTNSTKSHKNFIIWKAF